MNLYESMCQPWHTNTISHINMQAIKMIRTAVELRSSRLLPISNLEYFVPSNPTLNAYISTDLHISTTNSSYFLSISYMGKRIVVKITVLLIMPILEIIFIILISTEDIEKSSTFLIC